MAHLKAKGVMLHGSGLLNQLCRVAFYNGQPLFCIGIQHICLVFISRQPTETSLDATNDPVQQSNE